MDKQPLLPTPEESKQHYRVPEDYFDQLEERIMARIPETPVEAEAEPARPSLWVRVRPIVYLAAVFVSMNLVFRAFRSVIPPDSTTPSRSPQRRRPRSRTRLIAPITLSMEPRWQLRMPTNLSSLMAPSSPPLPTPHLISLSPYNETNPLYTPTRSPAPRSSYGRGAEGQEGARSSHALDAGACALREASLPHSAS